MHEVVSKRVASLMPRAGENTSERRTHLNIPLRDLKLRLLAPPRRVHDVQAQLDAQHEPDEHSLYASYGFLHRIYFYLAGGKPSTKCDKSSRAPTGGVLVRSGLR